MLQVISLIHYLYTVNTHQTFFFLLFTVSCEPYIETDKPLNKTKV